MFVRVLSRGGGGHAKTPLSKSSIHQLTRGEGVKQNHKKAFNWYRMVVEQGYALGHPYQILQVHRPWLNLLNAENCYRVFRKC